MCWTAVVFLHHCSMPWQVVEFLPHGKYSGCTIQAVPSAWVRSEEDTMYVLYPEHEGLATAIQAIRRQQQPSESWGKLKIKFATAPFDSLAEALKFEYEMDKCEDTDLGAFVDAIHSGKRRRIQKNLKYPNESSSSDEIGPNVGIALPPPPKNWMKMQASRDRLIALGVLSSKSAISSKEQILHKVLLKEADC